MLYEGHLTRVAARVSVDKAKVVTWLHDTVEDTAVTFEEIATLFGNEAAHSVRCMTHPKGVPYEEHLITVKSNPVARMVKISDLIDNSKLSRLPQVTLKDVQRQAKYNRALQFMIE